MIRDDKSRCQDILQAINKCERYLEQLTPDSSADFTEMIEDAIERNLQIIGEAVSRLSRTVSDSNPEIPWAQIRGFRNVLVHEYFGVDIQIIRDVVENHLPALKSALEDYLKQTQL